jgi:hypothetical protein
MVKDPDTANALSGGISWVHESQILSYYFCIEIFKGMEYKKYYLIIPFSMR